VLAHDPFVSPERAQLLGVELAESLDDVIRNADFLTLHTVLTAQTRHLIGAEQLALAKPSLRLVNTARGDLIDIDALVQAVDEGRIAGAAIDVFPAEPPDMAAPVLHHERIIVTPHLGASTAEAQERVAVDVALQILAILRGEPAQYAVNAPMIAAETMSVIAPYIPVAERVASLATQLSEGQLGTIEIEYLGDIANHDTTALKAAVIKGLLGPVSEENVTIVNANLIAEHRDASSSARGRRRTCTTTWSASPPHERATSTSPARSRTTAAHGGDQRCVDRHRREMAAALRELTGRERSAPSARCWASTDEHQLHDGESIEAQDRALWR
jgi:D-3-phosphoglycerate dehydrogenase